MKNSLTSQQNLGPTVRVDTKAAQSLVIKSKLTSFPEKGKSLNIRLCVLDDIVSKTYFCMHILCLSYLQHHKPAVLRVLVPPVLLSALVPLVDVCDAGS